MTVTVTMNGKVAPQQIKLPKEFHGAQGQKRALGEAPKR
jgi:hypothetical protein